MGGEQKREGKEGMEQRQRLKNWDKSLLREKRAVEVVVGSRRALKEED